MEESCKGYAFTNQDVRDKIYRGVPSQDRCRFHVAIGRNLVRNFTQGELKDNFYPVLHQFHLGMDDIKNQAERNAIAALCLHAGELAVSNGDCRAASQYLEFRIELLESNCWEEEYDLTLALYNASAEVEYGTANFERVDWLVLTVLERAMSF
jgi:predicted ATPase